MLAARFAFLLAASIFGFKLLNEGFDARCNKLLHRGASGDRQLAEAEMPVILQEYGQVNSAFLFTHTLIVPSNYRIAALSKTGYHELGS